MTPAARTFYRVNLILPKGSNPVCPRGSNYRAFSTTSSESDATHIWGVTLNDTEGNDSWKISKSAGKTNSGRSVLPICAYKLK